MRTREIPRSHQEPLPTETPYEGGPCLTPESDAPPIKRRYCTPYCNTAQYFLACSATGRDARMTHIYSTVEEWLMLLCDFNDTYECSARFPDNEDGIFQRRLVWQSTMAVREEAGLDRIRSRASGNDGRDQDAIRPQVCVHIELR